MKWDVVTQGITSGATYDASVQDYYEDLQKQYERAKRQQAVYEKQKREYERQRKERKEKEAKLERDRQARLEKLKKETSVEEREKAAVRAQEKWGNGETPDQRDIDLFEISDYKKILTDNKDEDAAWYDKAVRKFKDFFLSNDGITATGWKTNDIQASQFSGNIAKSREDQVLLNMAEDYFRGNKNLENTRAIQELTRRKPGFLNSVAVYANKALDWIGNNSVTGTTGAFLGTDELDKVRINIDFDENTESNQALQNIESLRNAYKAFDEESYDAYLENYNKARYYENMLSNEQKRKIDIAEGRIPDEHGIVDGSVEFFNFSKLKYQLPGIIAGSISSPSQFFGSFATGIATAIGVAATAAGATAAVAGTGGLATPAVLGALTGVGAGTTFGLNQAQGAHENAAEVDEGYVSKIKYALEQHPGIAASFYEDGREFLGKGATDEQIITAKLANKIPSSNTIVDKIFDDAAAGSQKQYDRDMVATTMDSTVDTALQITPFKFFSTVGKAALKSNLGASRIARAADKVGEKLSRLNGGDEGALRKAFGKFGATVSGKYAAIGYGTGAVLDNTLGRIPKVNTAIKAMAQMDISKIKRLGPKKSLWLGFGGNLLGRGIKSSISEGIEEGKQYYNQQLAVQEFQEGLKNGNLNYETQTMLEDVLDDFQAGDFAASGLIQAVTGIPLMDTLHYTDTNIIEAAEAIKNIKSGMIGGHGQTTAMTFATGLKQAVGTHGAIDDLELAIRALENNKLTAQKQFAQDQVLSKTNRKYIVNAIDYLKNSDSTKLSDEELENLQKRAIEVKGISDNKEVKNLAKRLGIAKDDYHAFVADYMYHLDNIEAESEVQRNAEIALNAKANEVFAESGKIVNPSDETAEKWSKNDIDNSRRHFETSKDAQVKRLQAHLQQLNDKLEKQPLNNNQRANLEKEISSVEESLKKAQDAKFDDSKKISYAQGRFDRINTLARIRGAVKQLSFLQGILSSMGEENTKGKEYVQKQIDSTKKLLNSWLVGNKLKGEQLTADNLDNIQKWSYEIATDIERGDKDNMFLQGPSAELSGQIESLAQAYQEYHKASLNYNISKDLLTKFIGYYTNDKGDIVEEGTEGAKYVKGTAKEHLEGIMAAQDDDAKLEQAYRKGFAEYGFAGVYKDDSPLVEDQNQQEEEEKPGTAERRQTIKKLGSKIRDFASRAKNYISGTWENLGNKKIFIPDEPEDRSELDPSENQMDAEEYFGKIVMDFKDADNVEAWLDGQAIDTDGVSAIKSNAHLLTSAYIETLDVADGVEFLFGDQDDRIVDVTYNGVEIGTITPYARYNKANGDSINDIGFVPDGFDLSRINDDAYLESLVKPEPEPEGTVVPGTVTPTLGEQDVTTPENMTDEQEAKINVLKDLAEKMNSKFDSTLRTSSHYFEWVGTGENRKLKLWHRLHDEIGSNFTVEPQDKKNWSDQIKKLYSIVYHNGYSEDNPEGSRDIQALLNHLQDFYNNPESNERLLERIEGYILYLKQEGEDISNSDLYECIKGISEEIAQETNYKGKNIAVDRGTAIDVLCRIILGTVFETPEKALEYCKIARMTTKSGVDILVKDLFTEESFKDAVTHLWNVRKVYVDVLGYTLWTAPFTIYTEDYTNEDGSSINIAGEIDMLAIDKDGRPIIIDFKTSKYPFFDENGKLSSSFTTVGGKATKSAQEQYINQQSAYIEMLNETTRKETAFAGGFKCNEARLLPIRLISNPRKSDIIGTVDIQFSKDQQLVLQTIPFKQLGEKEGLIFDKESYRKKLDELSRLYAKVKYIVDRLAIYYANDKNRQMLDQMNGIKDDLDSIYLSLQEITASDLQEYGDKLDNAIQFMQDAYFGHKTEIDELCKKYHPGELDNLDEADRASSFNNLNWDNPLNENDIESLGGFKVMGVKDREEYDKTVEELAHVACNGDFKTNSSAKLTAIQYKTRRGNDKIAVYAAITYNGKTYPPIRLYLSKKNGEQFAKDVLDGKNVSANIMTTVGLLSKCSDGNQHSIAESKQLVNAIGGTEENPYENFMVDASSNMNVAVVTFNKTTGVLSTVSGDPQNDVEVVLPKTLKTARANGHIVINVFPENSNLGKPIPIICNTPQINESLGKDKSNYKNQSLLEFLVDTVLQQIDSVEVGDPLEQYLEIDGEEIPLKLGQILNFFFEPHDPNNSNLIERPQYAIMAPSGGSEHRRIYIGNFAKEGGIKSISLDDIEALKDAIRQLSIWISTEMASVKWNSSKPGSEQFNKFAEFLSKLEDGERFYLGNTNIYFDKSDADGTFLGFLAKNGLLTTPFNGFSHPLISIDDCQEDGDDASPAVLDNDNNPFKDSIVPEELEEGAGPTGPEAFASEDGEEEGSMFSEFAGLANQLDPEADYHLPSLEKLQSKRSRLDETAARQYIEKVLGKSFDNLQFVDEISSAIVGALSAGTFIAGQVTANMMKLSHYAQNGTEYHEAFHWAFELIIDPKTSNRVRAAVRKRHGIRGEREIAEWLADAYMHYVRNIYTPNGNIIQRAFGKIKQWAITFSHMFTCEYQIYKVFNSIHNGKFANKPINNEAVLKFQEKFKELNSKNPSGSYEKDGIKYKFLQGPTDHEKSIEEVAFLVLNKVLHSPAVYYVQNKSFVVNVKAIHNINFARQLMMLPHKENGEDKKGYTTEQILKARNNPKYQQYYSLFDKALALRELVDDEHIEKTQEYVSAYIDRILGLKGKDLSVYGQDDSSEETTMDQTYADAEAGDYSSDAGSVAEHIVPDHQISRMSKTSSRVKLFFATIPMMENTSENHNRFRVNKYGKFGYYELREVYQTIQNRYHHVLSREALWKAIEADSKSNPMAYSLWKRISAIKKLASEGNDNAIGLLNEIYKSLKSTKQSHEVQKTRRVPGESWVTYKSVNIMVQNNSYAISREFTDTVLGGFNKFYEIVPYKNGKGEKVFGIKVRSKIQDELSNDVYPSSYRDASYEAFFGSGYKNIQTIVEEIDPNDRTKRIQKKNQKIVHSIYDVLYSYGTSDQKPLYVYQKNKGGYIEVSIENSLPYIKLQLIEALSSIGVDITEEQLDDILETQFGGIGISQLKQLLIQKFTLPAKGNVHAAGASVTLRSAADNLYTLIRSEEDQGFVPGVIGVREEEYRGNIRSINGKDVFRNKQIHLLMSTLIATAQQEKYEVSARGVDGKLSYAMSDDNTVTAMCDVVFDKTGDPQCTAIRDMIINDPFNMSNGAEQFGNIPIGSYILPQVLSSKGKNIDYQIVNDAGIETGNRENSSTNSDKRGADTIMSTISKLCQNMIVLAPFADKSTALGIRLNGIRIPGLDYSKTTYTFKDEERTDEDASQRGNTPLRQFINSVQAITVDDTGKVLLNKKDNILDQTIAQYVLAEYYQAKKAIQDYEDILRNGADGVAKNKTAFNICKKLMFMSQFSGDYVQVQDDKTKQWRWVFKPFGVEKGSNKTDLEAAKEMISQFESIVNNYDTLLSFVNRHINGLMQHELEKLEENGIIKKTKHSKQLFIRNQLLDNNIITAIGSGVRRRNREDSVSESRRVVHQKAVRIFMYDIVGKAIISKQESERLFTGQSDLYEIVRDKETRIITVPYQDQAKRIGSFASTGTVGAVEREDYVCAEIADDMQSIEDQVVRSVYMNEIAYYQSTGGIDMSKHPGFDFRFATSKELRDLIPEEYHPLVDKKIENIMRGFVLTKKNGSENKNNVTDGAAFISAKFTKQLLKQQGAWNHEIAKAFDRLTSDKPQDANQILNDYKTFNDVWTQVIGMYKYTAVGFRTEIVNGHQKVVPYVNKYALAPVFACMCNDKMDAIRRQMESQNVDVLMFESAVKVGAHGNSDFTVDNNGNITGKFNTYSQKTFFLRKQLNTDPNEKELLKIGIQTVKVALSAAIGEKNINWRGEVLDGDEIIDRIMKDIDKLTTARYEKLTGKLDTPEHIVDYVVNFLRGNNVPEPIIEEFKNGVPAEALGIQKHIDTLSAKRTQEDIVRINAPGSAFIQRCVYGVEGPAKFGSLELNDGEELKVVNSDGSMDCVVSMDYYVEFKHGIPYFKLTPKGHKKIKLTVVDKETGKERAMSFEEIRKWLKDNNIIGKNSKPSILSYRIPTQAVASINALKCVDIIPVVRDTVVLPKLFTTITGADFDIDKLFMSTVWYSVEEQEDGSYKVSQLQDDTTEEGLSNNVVNDYIDILCQTAINHPEIFYMSIDQDTKLADDVIAWIKEKYPPTEQEKLDSSSGILSAMPSMQAKVHDEFLAGRQGIGPFALALVNHVLTRIYKVSFNPQGIYLQHKSLARDEDDYGKSIMSWLSAMINKHVDVAKNPDITYLNVNDSTFNVVALLLRLGYGRRTFMFTCQDIMRDYAFAINQEEAVCKYTKNDNGYDDYRQEAYNKIIEKYKLDSVIDKFSKIPKSDLYRAACQEIFDRNINGVPLCEYILANGGKVPTKMDSKGKEVPSITITIGKDTYELTDKIFQFLNLQLFNYLSDVMAKPLTALQQATVIDNERCITSMIQSEFYKQSVAEVMEGNTFDKKAIHNLFNNSYISGKINKVTKVMDTIYDACSCMDKDVVTTVAKSIDPNILMYGKDRMQTFLSSIRDGMVAYYGAKFFDNYCQRNNINKKELFKQGSKGIVGRLAEIQASARSNRGKYKSLRNNLLIRGLSIDAIIGEEYIEDPEKILYNEHRFNGYEFLKFKYAGQSDDNMLGDVQQAWDELLAYHDEKIQKFARDLVVYAFYTSGEMSGSTKLFKYVPPSWRVYYSRDGQESGGYADYFARVKEDKKNQYENIDDIIDKLCRNLWCKDKFVRTMNISTLLRFEGSDILKNNKKTVSSGEYMSEGEDSRDVPNPVFSPVIAGIQHSKNGVSFIFMGGKEKCPRYLKCVDIHHDNRFTTTDDDAGTWVLYKLVGFNKYIDEQGTDYDYPIYVQTSALGEKYYRNNIFEFSDMLEENHNLDAYEMTKQFIKNLGIHKQKIAADDVSEAFNNVVEVLHAVTMGVNMELYFQADKIAEETMDIFIDNSTGKTTFQPLKTKDEYVAARNKSMEKRQDKICNRL